MTDIVGMDRLRPERFPARQGPSEAEWNPPPQDNGAVEMGTVGWNDGSEIVDPGTPENGGVTLIKVTLYRGRDPKSEHTPGAAQGTQILARNSGGDVVPAAGSQVYVARPAGFDGPGCWCIIANPGAPVAPVQPAEGGTFFTRGLDGTISFGTTSDGTKDGTLVQFQIKRDGFLFMGPFGKISFDRGGFHLLHFTGARLDLGGIGGLPSPIDQLATYATLSAAITKIQASALVLGPDAGVSDNVAHSTSVVAAIEAIAAQVDLMQAAFDVVSAILGAAAGPVLSSPAILIPGSPIANAVAGIVAMDSAVAAATPLIPSQSTGAT
jgi:hypothetical protein